MNKDDLLLLKKSFGNKKRYTEYIGAEGPLYNDLFEQEILCMMSSNEAVDAVMEVLKKMIIHLSSRDVSYNGIALAPSFSVFVDNEFVSEDGYIISPKAILNDYVGISFSQGYVYSGKAQKVFSVSDIEESAHVFYAPFSEFVVGLNECGLELEGISSFADIRQLAYKDKTPTGRIRVSFIKNRTYCKKSN